MWCTAIQGESQQCTTSVSPVVSLSPPLHINTKQRRVGEHEEAREDFHMGLILLNVDGPPAGGGGQEPDCQGLHYQGGVKAATDDWT